MFVVQATAAAARELERLPPQIQRRFRRAFEQMESGLRPRPGLDIKPIEGRRGFWRLRVGHYRGIFDVYGNSIRFTSFGHRSTVYR